MARKTTFQKAAKAAFGRVIKSPDKFQVTVNDITYRIEQEDDRIRCGSSMAYVDSYCPATATVGQLARFMIRSTHVDPTAVQPPSKLGGGGKELENPLLDEAGRLEKQGILTMSRCGTTAVTIGTGPDAKQMQIPSYPDFEGVTPGGKQFILEVKICSQSSFRIKKEFIKHKQVRHMLARAKFGVPCWTLIHFNERMGATFYDLPFTVAIPVKASPDGGWEEWEKFAECKDKSKEFGSITRELARKIGTPVRWHIPGRCKNPRPDLRTLVASAT